jgi:hypothetical protein
MKNDTDSNAAKKLFLSKETLKSLHVSTSVKTGGTTTYPGYSYTCHPSPCGSIIRNKP